MVDKAKIQAYIATLPPKERAKFQKLPQQQQISIMNKALGTTSTKPKANSNTSSLPKFSQRTMNSVFMNDRYTCQSDNTRVMYPHVEIARKEVQVKQELKKAGKEQPRKLNLKPISAQSKQLRQGIVSRMQKSYNTAVTSFNGQMQKDGWAGDVADGISKLWNNNLWNITGNTADMVRADLRQYHAQTADLKASISRQDFPAKFKQIYGINYNEQNIKAFYNTEKKVKNVATAVTTSKAVQSAFNLPLKQFNENFGIYKDHVEVLHGSTGTMERKVPKEVLLKTMKNKVEELVGEKGVAQIAKQSNIDLSKLDDAKKYTFYGKIAQQLVDSSKNAEKKALNGKSFEYYERQYDASYTRAFGTKNNIQKRVAKYNTSQEIGTAAVKSGAQAVVVVGSTVAIVASGGSATPLVVAGISGAASVAIDVTDKATNGIKGDVKKSMPGILKSGMIDAAFSYAGGNVAKGITSVVKPTTKVGTVAVKAAANGIGAATEGTVKDAVTGGLNNFSVKTFALRALIASTLGNVKLVTNNDALVKTIGVGKSATMTATIKSVKIDLKEQAKAQGATEAQKVVQFMEQNPEEFEKIVMEVAQEQADTQTLSDNRKVGQVIEQKTDNIEQIVVDIQKDKDKIDK